MTLRRAAERGHTEFGWLDSWHTFSFGEYHDHEHQQYRSLRVINDDRVAPGGGFGMHPHRDMEILSYVLEGELAHKDSLGNGTTIRPGEWQVMSAGTGVRHSEFNPSQTASVHFLQIWIQPNRTGLTPSYDQKAFTREAKRGQWCLIASPDGREGSILIHQDATLRAAILTSDTALSVNATPGRGSWLHVATGEVLADGQRLKAGDAIAIENQTVELRGTDTDAEVLWFELA